MHPTPSSTRTDRKFPLTDIPTGLTAALVRRLADHQPGLIEGFLASAGLDLTPFCNPRN
jgi:hypothetical protein